MKKPLPTFLTALLFVACSTNPSPQQAPTSEPSTPESTTRELLEINREILEPMILENDPSGLLKHAHEKFLVIAPGGVVEDRDKAAAGAQSFSATDVSISDEQVTLVGDTAVLVGKLEIDGEMRPVGELPPMKFMAAFVHVDGEWKLLARALTPCFPMAIEHGLC